MQNQQKRIWFQSQVATELTASAQEDLERAAHSARFAKTTRWHATENNEYPQILGEIGEKLAKAQITSGVQADSYSRNEKSFPNYDIFGKNEVSQVKAYNFQKNGKPTSFNTVFAELTNPSSQGNQDAVKRLLHIKEKEPEKWEQLKEHLPDTVINSKDAGEMQKALAEKSTLRIPHDQLEHTREKLKEAILRDPNKFGVNPSTQDIDELVQSRVLSIDERYETKHLIAKTEEILQERDTIEEQKFGSTNEQKMPPNEENEANQQKSSQNVEISESKDQEQQTKKVTIQNQSANNPQPNNTQPTNIIENKPLQQKETQSQQTNNIQNSAGQNTEPIIENRIANKAQTNPTQSAKPKKGVALNNAGAVHVEKDLEKEQTHIFSGSGALLPNDTEGTKVNGKTYKPHAHTVINDQTNEVVYDRDEYGNVFVDTRQGNPPAPIPTNSNNTATATNNPNSNSQSENQSPENQTSQQSNQVNQTQASNQQENTVQNENNPKKQDEILTENTQNSAGTNQSVSNTNNAATGNNPTQSSEQEAETSEEINQNTNNSQNNSAPTNTQEAQTSQQKQDETVATSETEDNSEDQDYDYYQYYGQ